MDPGAPFRPNDQRVPRMPRPANSTNSLSRTASTLADFYPQVIAGREALNDLANLQVLGFASSPLPLANAVITHVTTTLHNDSQQLRLRDCGDENRLYDPTFCTTTGNNYDAIEGSTQPLVTQNDQVIAEVFGEEHLVVTPGQTRDIFQASQSTLNNRYIIQDSSYV